MYVIAFMYLVPGWKTVACANGEAGAGRVHVMAVVSRDAESMRLSVGETTALT